MTMGFIIGLAILVLIGVFVFRQFSSDGITTSKLKKYFLYIIILIAVFIIYLIINH